MDSNGNESEIARKEINYDNIPPEIGKIEIEGKRGDNGWYTGEKVEVRLENAVDRNSGIEGYYAWEITKEMEANNIIPSETEMKYSSSIENPIEIIADGTKKVGIKLKDKAGNESLGSITINKDSTEPMDFSIAVENIKPTKFTIKAGTTDDISGIDRYRYFVNGEQKGEIQGTSFDVTGLEPNKSYSVYVEAIDKAGNVKKSTPVIISTTEGLQAPIIEPKGAEVNGYYKTGLEIEIKAASDGTETLATKIVYIINGKTVTVTGTRATFKLEEDGTYRITTYSEDKDGNRSGESTIEIKTVSKPPSPKIEVTSGEKGEEDWYTSDIGILVDGSDELGRTAKIRYKVERNGIAIEEATIEELSKTLTITENGEIKITAYTISQTGEETESILEIKKDTEEPSTAQLNITGKSALSIKVQARGADSHSGIKSYEFIYKETGESSYKTAKTIETNAGTCDYTYENLKINTGYNLAVRVTDKAGHTTISEVITEAVKNVSQIDYKGNSIGDLGALPQGEYTLSYIEEEQKLYIVEENQVPDLSGKGHTLYLKDGAIVQKDSSGNSYISFDGAGAYGQIEELEETIDWAGGFTIEFEACWDAFTSHSRILDFGNGKSSNNILISNRTTTTELYIDIQNGSTQQSNYPLATISPAGVVDKYRLEYTKTSSGYTITTYKNGERASEYQRSAVINNIRRTANYLGKSNWSTDGWFKGKIYSLKITQANGEKILEYDLNKMANNSIMIKVDADGYKQINESLRYVLIKDGILYNSKVTIVDQGKSYFRQQNGYVEYYAQNPSGYKSGMHWNLTNTAGGYKKLICNFTNPAADASSAPGTSIAVGTSGAISNYQNQTYPDISYILDTSSFVGYQIVGNDEAVFSTRKELLINLKTTPTSFYVVIQTYFRYAAGDHYRTFRFYDLYLEK